MTRGNYTGQTAESQSADWDRLLTDEHDDLSRELELTRAEVRKLTRRVELHDEIFRGFLDEGFTAR